MSDLVERLREKNGRGKHALGYHPLINPDGPEAADRIEQLEREVERLRGAVKVAYREGYLDAHEGSARFEAESEAEAYWRLSDAAAALQETADEPENLLDGYWS